MNSSNYICSDETTINVLNNEKSNNYMWVHMSGNRKQRAVVYEYQESRSGSSTSDFSRILKAIIKVMAMLVIMNYIIEMI